MVDHYWRMPWLSEVLENPDSWERAYKEREAAEVKAELNLYRDPDPRPRTPDANAQRAAARERQQALTRMARNLRNGTALESQDVQALTRDELLHLRDRGDEYLRELIAQHERQRQRERER